MAQTEITVQIFEDIQIVKDKIMALNFNYLHTFSGRDVYFSAYNQNKINNIEYKELIDNSIIVRSYTKSNSEDLNSMILHKLKTVDENNNTIGEVKTSVKIDNPNNAINIFNNAGLTKWLNLEQENHFFKKEDIIIIVGTVSGLDGCFMEIEEYPSIKNLSEKEKFNHLIQFVKNLNFDIGNDFSCKKTLMLYNKNNNLC